MCIRDSIFSAILTEHFPNIISRNSKALMILDVYKRQVFTFLPFYKQNIVFFLFLTYHCRVVDFGYSEDESLSYCCLLYTSRSV